MPTSTVRPSSTRVLHGPGAVAATVAALGRLSAEANVPLYTSALWVSTFARIHGEEHALAVLVEGAGGIDAAALLNVSGGRIARVVPFGAPLNDLTVFAHRDPDSARRLAEGIVASLEELESPWRLELGQLPQDDPVADALAAALVHAERVPGTGVPFARFGHDRNPGSYLSAKLRSEVRRMRRRMAEDHEVELTTISEPGEVERAVVDAVALRRRRDESLGRPSGLENAADRQFFVEVVAAYASQGRGEITVLHLDGALAGYLVGLVEGDVYTAWDQRIEDAFAQYSPGKVLYAHVIEDVLGRTGIAAIDFGRGTQETKLRYANDVVGTQALTAWSSPWLRRFDQTRVRLREKARRLVNDTPALQKAWRTTRRIEGRVRNGR